MGRLTLLQQQHPSASPLGMGGDQQGEEVGRGKGEDLAHEGIGLGGSFHHQILSLA